MMNPQHLSRPTRSEGADLLEPTRTVAPQEQNAIPASPADAVNDNERNATEPSQKPPDHVQNRVCVTCRRRKVKCDKQKPCQNCVKAGTECVFPAKRSAMDGQSAADTELLHELRRLEPLFQSLVSKINDDGVIEPPPQNKAPILESVPHLPQTINVAPVHRPPSPSRLECSTKEPGTIRLPSLHGSPITNNSVSGSEVMPWSPYGTTVGKLVKDSGRNRYISGFFWDALHMEDDDSMSESMSEASAEGDLPSPEPDPTTDDYIFLGQGTPSRHELQSLHPPKAQRLRAWQLFKENVQPLVSVLHIPTAEPAILEGLESLDERLLPSRLEPLIFVVYYGAVTSLSPSEVLEEFGGEQRVLLRQYRSGLQSAFSHARLLETDQVPVLQAFVLFLTILRRHDPSLSWNLTGLAVRLAQSRGMHRDGSFLGLSKFDAEIRRRLWWAICLLDTASSEDHSCTPTILEVSSFDAALPRNYNDSDLDPKMTDYPLERAGLTDTWFIYARCRLNDIWRTIVDNRRPAGEDGKSFAVMNTSEKVGWIEQQRQQLEKDFLQSTPTTDPLQWATETLVKLLICNLQLFVYNPLGQSTTLTEEEKSIAFLKAIQTLEHSYSLRTDPRGRKWAWLLGCYHEWFALALVLSELCARPLGEYVDRAWQIVEQSVVLRWNSAGDHRRAHQWRSITKTLDKARAERKKARKHKRANSASHVGTTHAKRAKHDGNDLAVRNTSHKTPRNPHFPSTADELTASIPPPHASADLTGHEHVLDPNPFDQDTILYNPDIDSSMGLDLDHNFFDIRVLDSFLHTTRYTSFTPDAGG